MNALEWLLARVPEVNALTAEEHEAIMSFSLLWSLFESRSLSGAASARTIMSLVYRWDELSRLSAEEFQEDMNTSGLGTFRMASRLSTSTGCVCVGMTVANLWKKRFVTKPPMSGIR